MLNRNCRPDLSTHVGQWLPCSIFWKLGARDLTLIQFPYENIDLRLCARVVVIKVLFMEHVRRVFALFFLLFFFILFFLLPLVVGQASLARYKKLLTATIARVGWKICSNDYICLLHGGAIANELESPSPSLQSSLSPSPSPGPSPSPQSWQVPSYDWVLMSWEKCIKENQFPESQLDKWVYSCHKRELQLTNKKESNGTRKWKLLAQNNGLTNV